MVPAICVQKGLQRSHRQLRFGVRNHPQAVHSLTADLCRMPLSPASMRAGIERLKGVPQIPAVHMEQYPVDGFKGQRVIVKIHHLHQGVPGGQGRPLLRRRHLFQIFVAGFGGGQRMIAVSHGEQQRGRVRHAVLIRHGLRTFQGAQGVGHPAHLTIRQPPALHMAAAQHEVRVIEGFHDAGLHCQRFDHASPRIVDQQHHMGQFQSRVLPHPYPRWDALQHRPLRGPDQRPGARGEVILLQINAADQTMPHPAVRLRALQIDQAVRECPEQAIRQVAVHRSVDGLNSLVHIRAVQIDLWQHQPQG